MFAWSLLAFRLAPRLYQTTKRIQTTNHLNDLPCWPSCVYSTLLNVHKIIFNYIWKKQRAVFDVFIWGRKIMLGEGFVARISSLVHRSLFGPCFSISKMQKDQTTCAQTTNTNRPQRPTLHPHDRKKMTNVTQTKFRKITWISYDIIGLKGWKKSQRTA